MDVSDSAISVSSLGDRVFVTEHRLVNIGLRILIITLSVSIAKCAVQLAAE